MPILFIGHGSPMNALEDNSFTQKLRELGTTLPRPKAILCISAHWMTEGSWITNQVFPKTIHDFYGFPPALFEVEYPAAGNPSLAKLVTNLIPEIHLDNEMWGYDHGTWSILRHLYPEADIPLLQLSLHLEKPPVYHYELGQKLAVLRDQGVLIIASGNIVHNLRTIRWGDDPPSYPWASEFDEWVKTKLEGREFGPLMTEAFQSPAGKMSIPTPEHYYPLLYILGAASKDDILKFEFEGMQNGSISMRSLSFTP